MGMNNVMADIETASTETTAAILSIGAVLFDPDQNRLGATFYVNVSMTDCARYGLHVNEDTLRWWQRQSQAARDALEDPEPVSLYDAMFRFKGFVDGHCANKRQLWGNGCTFDNMILRNAAREVGIRFPFHFTQDRDVRTLVALDRHGCKKKQERVGTAHNALDDAVYQALYCMAIWRRLRGHG